MLRTFENYLVFQKHLRIPFKSRLNEFHTRQCGQPCSHLGFYEQDASTLAWENATKKLNKKQGNNAWEMVFFENAWKNEPFFQKFSDVSRCQHELHLSCLRIPGVLPTAGGGRWITTYQAANGMASGHKLFHCMATQLPCGTRHGHRGGTRNGTRQEGQQ